jgi:RimJ/RimL family protein N-acetyltransferase
MKWWRPDIEGAPLRRARFHGGVESGTNEPGPWPSGVPPELTDGRLLVRSWRSEDAPWLAAACQDPEIQRWTTVPSPYTEADATRFVTDLAPNAWKQGRGWHAAVTDAATGDGLGAVGVVPVAGLVGVAEVGYYTAVHRRRRGVTSGAVDLVVDWVWSATGLDRLELHVDPRNRASAAVALHCGFALDGVLPARGVHRGERHDVALYSLLRP